jgi:hypothetical protein
VTDFYSIHVGLPLHCTVMLFECLLITVSKAPFEIHSSSYGVLVPVLVPVDSLGPLLTTGRKVMLMVLRVTCVSSAPHGCCSEKLL